MNGEIIFNIDVMLAKRKMKMTELADIVGITPAEDRGTLFIARLPFCIPANRRVGSQALRRF